MKQEIIKTEGKRHSELVALSQQQTDQVILQLSECTECRDVWLARLQAAADEGTEHSLVGLEFSCNMCEGWMLG